MSEGAGQPSQRPDDHEARKQKFIAAIYGQESSSGAADTRQPNDQGVIGPMQIKQSTFEDMKKNGQLPPHADFYNPNHSKRAGEIHAAYLFDKYNGNIAQAAAAYYGGEKAVQRDGSIRNFGNTKHADHPTTLQYAQNIAERMSHL